MSRSEERLPDCLQMSWFATCGRGFSINGNLLRVRLFLMGLFEYTFWTTLQLDKLGKLHEKEKETVGSWIKCTRRNVGTQRRYEFTIAFARTKIIWEDRNEKKALSLEVRNSEATKIELKRTVEKTVRRSNYFLLKRISFFFGFAALITATHAFQRK